MAQTIGPKISTLFSLVQPKVKSHSAEYGQTDINGSDSNPETSRPVIKPLTATEIPVRPVLPTIQPYIPTLQTIISMLGAQQRLQLLQQLKAKTEQLRSEAKTKLATSKTETSLPQLLSQVLTNEVAKELQATLKRLGKDPKRFSEMTREESGRGNVPLYMFAALAFTLAFTKAGFEDSDFGEQQPANGGYDPNDDITLQVVLATVNQTQPISDFIDKQLETAKNDTNT